MNTRLIIRIILPGALLIALVGVAMAGWSFSGGTLNCDGFWKGNIDSNGQTDCVASNVDLLYVWCTNSNEPGKVNPPKVTAVSSFDFSASESNLNGKRERGKFNQTIQIDLDASLNADEICSQGNSNPNANGQWSIVKTLIAESTSDELADDGTWIATVTTSNNKGEMVMETYECGNGSLFADGTNIEDKLPAINMMLSAGMLDLSPLNLVYNCVEQ